MAREEAKHQRSQVGVSVEGVDAGMEGFVHSQFPRNTTPVFKLNTQGEHWKPLPGCDLLSTIFDGENNSVDTKRLNTITQELLLVCRGAMTEAMIRGLRAVLTAKSTTPDSFIPLAFVFLQLLVIPEIRREIPNISNAHGKFLQERLPKLFDKFHQGVDGIATSHLTPQNVDMWVRQTLGRMNMLSKRVHCSTPVRQLPLAPSLPLLLAAPDEWADQADQDDQDGDYDIDYGDDESQC